MIQRVFKWTTTCLRNIITRPREELDRWQRAARFFYDLARYGAQQLRHDRASQMAGALAFRSLFALLPVFIVGMIVIKAVRGTDSFLDLAHTTVYVIESGRRARLVSNSVAAGV